MNRHAPPRSRRRAVARLDPPPEVREIAATLERRGYETWCVGGAVRDALLGIRHLDWDLATAAPPAEVRRAFRRTVPVGEQFGTIGVLDRHGRMHEVTTFRHDVQTDGRHAVVEFGASLEEDLARRDFTINAIAYSPSRDEISDPFGGREDLERGVVRAVGEARARMTEDRLRALRAIRFAGRFGFRIESATWQAIVESTPFLDRLSRERIKQELEKTMEQVHSPSGSIARWQESGALRALLPAIDGQPPWVFASPDRCALPDASGDPGRKRRRTLVRIATLFVGLPAEDTRRTLRGLRFSNRDVEWIAQIAGSSSVLREDVRAAMDSAAPTGDGAYRRWAALAGRTRLADTLRVTLASLDAERALQPDAARRARAAYRRALRVAYRDPVELGDLTVDGEELIRDAGIAPGPAVGATLRRLLALVLEDPSRNSRAVLIDAARAWGAQERGGHAEEGA